MTSAILGLLGVIALGCLAAAVRMFPNTDQAIATLNRYALYLAFPALIVSSLGSPQLRPPSGWGFIAAHFIALAVYLPCTVITARILRSRSERLVVPATALFGNIAYLGIPFCAAVFGAETIGLAAASASIHITISMTLGPYLLARASRGEARAGATIARIARQPLVWAPLVGLLLRLLPPASSGPAVRWLGGVGASAGPVALFMIGLYLWTHRGAVRSAGRPALLLLGQKLFVYPLVTLSCLLIFGGMLDLSPVETQLMVVMAAMPVAVTTFAIAEEYGVGRATVAAGIVVSTALSLGLLVLWTEISCSFLR